MTTPARHLRSVNTPWQDNDPVLAALRAARDRRGVASGEIEAITPLPAFSPCLEDAPRQAITGLRASGYSWADIALRLGITRQGAQQRWGDSPAPVTDTSSTPANGSCP